MHKRVRRDLILKSHPNITHTWWCSGCQMYHWVDAKVWKVTEDPNGPSVNPSIRVRSVHLCHVFIREGKVQYLSDCTHSLAGKTVALQEWEEIKTG